MFPALPILTDRMNLASLNMHAIRAQSSLCHRFRMASYLFCLKVTLYMHATKLPLESMLSTSFLSAAAAPSAAYSGNLADVFPSCLLPKTLSQIWIPRANICQRILPPFNASFCQPLALAFPLPLQPTPPEQRLFFGSLNIK